MKLCEIAQDESLLAGTIRGLLKKKEHVWAFASLWDSSTNSDGTPKYFDVIDMIGERVIIDVRGDGGELLWFELNPEDDDKLDLKRFDGGWVLKSPQGVLKI